MVNQNWYGRSLWIGVEPFLDPAQVDGRLTPQVLSGCLDAVTEILVKYWPNFWKNRGTSLPANATDLQREDFEVMASLQCRQNANVADALQQTRSSPSRHWPDWTHFLMEDTNQPSAWTLYNIERRENGTDDVRVAANFGVSLQYWLDDRVHDWDLELTMARFDKSYGWLLKSLKSYFQRPRPHQAMTDFDKPFFVFKTECGHHPALPAGHTLQSALWTATLLFESDLKPIWDSQAAGLQGWAAAVSDRRIYAGLHYPSDAIGGWIASSVLGRSIWNGSQMGAHLQQVMSASEPVQIIRQGARSGKYPILNSMLREI